MSFREAGLLPLPDNAVGEMRQIDHCIGHFEKDSLVSFFGFVPWDMRQNPISVILGKIKTPLAKIMWSDDPRKAVVFIHKHVVAL
jgi:hypothetical protein